MKWALCFMLKCARNDGWAAFFHKNKKFFKNHVRFCSSELYVYISASKNKKIKRTKFVYRGEVIFIFTSLNVEEREKMNNITEVNTNFYEKYNPQIRAIVTRILKNANQADEIDDCVNTVYLDLMSKLQLYNETRGTMAAFVAIIARSVALNYCKSNKRKTGELIGDDNIDFLSEPLGFENEVEFDMLIQNILKKLNEQEYILFTMRFILFYSTEEIAKAFKIRRNAVDVRINRLKGKVKNFLIKGGIKL